MADSLINSQNLVKTKEFQNMLQDILKNNGDIIKKNF